MPITFEIKPEKSLVSVIHEGVVGDDEFLSVYHQLFASDSFDTSYRLLVDLRKADSSARGTETLKKFAGFIMQQYADVDTSPRVAVVAAENISFGLARMYEAFSNTVPWDFKVFRDIGTAQDWLGLGADL